MIRTRISLSLHQNVVATPSACVLVVRYSFLIECLAASLRFVCQELDCFHVFYQVVLTSTNPNELCINGMSFSRRSSKWANAALVVTVSTKDFDLLNLNGPLAGIEFQVSI